MTAGLAAPPPDLTAQTGSGEPGRSVGAWVEGARGSPFHPATAPVGRENPTAPQDVETGTANARGVRGKLPPVPDNAVSPGRVFAFTLAGATIPLIPAMTLASRDRSDERYVLTVAGTLGLWATLVTVPIAAVAGGSGSLSLTLAATVVGFVAGVGATYLVVGVPNGEFWALPVFSVTMASVTTLITTM